MVNRPSITVNSNTNLQQIRDFVAQNGGDGKQLFAKTDKSGQQVLYMKKHAGFANTILGKTTGKQEAARSVLQKAVDNTYNQASGSQKTEIKDKLASISDFISSKIGEKQGSLRGDHVLRIVSRSELLIARLDRTPPTSSDDRRTTNDDYLSLSSFADKLLSGGAIDATKIALEAPIDAKNFKSQVEPFAKVLGEQIAKELLPENKDDNARARLTLSSGDILKSELKALLESQADAAIIDHLVNRAFEVAVAKVGLNSADLTMTRDIEMPMPDGKKISVEMPTLIIGGGTYHAERFIDEGSFGDVFHYVLETPKDDQGNPIPHSHPTDIAVKLSKPEVGSAEVLREYKNNVEAFGAGHPNVMGDPNIVRIEDGRIALTMEFLPNGNVQNFATKLESAVFIPEAGKEMPDGKIGQLEAKLVALTLMQDMAAGLGHLSETQGMIHCDFKGLNCNIGSDGRAKLIDFGTSAKADRLAKPMFEVVDNPTWKAPEILYDEAIGTAEGKLRKAIADQEGKILTEAFVDMGLKMNDPVSQDFVSSLAADISKTSVPKKFFNDNITVDTKVDMWALGVTAYNLFTDALPYDGYKQMFVRENEFVAWSKNNKGIIDPETPAGQKPTNGSLLSSTGHPEVDSLINKMMSARSGDRPDAAVLAQDKIFTENAAVGSPEVRNLIKALASGDASRITDARRALIGSQSVLGSFPDLPPEPPPGIAHAN